MPSQASVQPHGALLIGYMVISLHKLLSCGFEPISAFSFRLYDLLPDVSGNFPDRVLLPAHNPGLCACLRCCIAHTLIQSAYVQSQSRSPRLCIWAFIAGVISMFRSSCMEFFMFFLRFLAAADARPAFRALARRCSGVISVLFCIKFSSFDTSPPTNFCYISEERKRHLRVSGNASHLLLCSIVGAGSRLRLPAASRLYITPMLISSKRESCLYASD